MPSHVFFLPGMHMFKQLSPFLCVFLGFELGLAFPPDLYGLNSAICLGFLGRSWSCLRPCGPGSTRGKALSLACGRGISMIAAWKSVVGVGCAMNARRLVPLEGRMPHRTL